VWREDAMEEKLAQKYPQIRTFSAYAADDKSVTAKLDFTISGFHAIVFDHSGTYLIDPYSKENDGFYSCFHKKDVMHTEAQRMHCELPDATADLMSSNLVAPKLRLNGTVKRTFRLALSCTGEYAIAVAGPNPTKAAVLSKMVTTMNRVNGVYERELAVHMNLVADNDTLIFLDPTTDPFSNNSSASSMLTENPLVINSRIGSANYDIGHAFTTGAGGQAQLGSVCKNNSKAQGVTGRATPVGDPFDIDYVAHEMGHQFGANHTFNANSVSCAGNGVSATAYEPGSGSTIMAYAGICGLSNNLQGNSDDYFHAVSLVEITTYLTASNGATCAITTPALNTPPVVAPMLQTYQVPMLTPFELTAPLVTDTDHDTLTYCWEQWNRGDFRSNWSAASTRGPIFRSFKPDTSATRVFPRLDTLVDGVDEYLGEKLPDVDRFLTFRLTVRDIFNGLGSFNLPDDTVHLDVTSAAGPFTVTAPAASVNWLGNTVETITWDVASTNLPPVNCSQVDILLSVDGGYTYPIILAANTANDGIEQISVPNNIVSTTLARVKVKAVGNVFFNISPVNFIVTHNTGVRNVNWQNSLTISPVPANDMLHLMSQSNANLDVHVVNPLGQLIYRAILSQKLDIDVKNWSKGVYYIQLMNEASGERLVRPIIVD